MPRADRKTKATLIAQATDLTGYNRSYVTRLLWTRGRQLVLTPTDGPPLLLTAGRKDLRLVLTGAHNRTMIKYE